MIQVTMNVAFVYDEEFLIAHNNERGIRVKKSMQKHPSFNIVFREKVTRICHAKQCLKGQYLSSSIT